MFYSDPSVTSLPLYHPERQSFQLWYENIGKKLYEEQNKHNGFKNVKSIEELYQLWGNEGSIFMYAK